MPEIKFTATPELPFDIRHLNYKKGDVVELSESGCYRWIRRGVAEFYKGTAKEMPQLAVDPVVEPVIADAVFETAEAAIVDEIPDYVAIDPDGNVSDLSAVPSGSEDKPRRGRKPKAVTED